MPGLTHAKHNEDLCDLLIKTGGYDDWVITTAFYSAIHLVDHEIFPRSLGPEPDYGSFKQYLNRQPYGTAPHELRRKLVADHLSCTGAFNWLMDTCFNARYNQYVFPPDYAAQAKRCLDAIKKACKKK